MILERDIITKRYEEFREIIGHFEEIHDISSKIIVDDNFKKVLLLSATSYFEDRNKKIILDCVELNSNSDILKNFVKNKAIERQYHTYFDWREKNANKFFSLFGDSFKADINSEINVNEPLKKSVKDFMELGRLRNELVHENFAAFPIEKTSDEIFSLYLSANEFVNYLALRIKAQR